jgi:hypothetical protein
MIAMTTSNSIKLNPVCFCGFGFTNKLQRFLAGGHIVGKLLWSQDIVGNKLEVGIPFGHNV